MFVLYVLGSIVAGFLRGAGGRPAQPGQRPMAPEVLDMDDLERQLREARDREHPPPAAPPADDWTPTVQPAAPSPVRRPDPAAARPSTGSQPAEMQVAWDDDFADDWGDGSDSEWEDAERTARRRRPERKRAGDGRLPAPVHAFLDQGNPWQAAVVVKELLGPPRALAPYRTWPRD